MGNEELNARKAIGADLAGTTEIFKQMTATAVYLVPGALDEETQNKVLQFHSKNNNLNALGEKLSGISSYEEFKNQNGTVCQGANILFCSDFLSNYEYNERYHRKPDNNYNRLLAELECNVIQKLAADSRVDYEIILINNFNKGNAEIKLNEALGNLAGKAKLCTDADNILAIKCASIISSYFSALFWADFKERVKIEFGLDSDVVRGADTNGAVFKEFVKKLESKMEYKEWFMNTYSKIRK